MMMITKNIVPSSKIACLKNEKIRLRCFFINIFRIELLFVSTEKIVVISQLTCSFFFLSETKNLVSS